MAHFKVLSTPGLQAVKPVQQGLFKNTGRKTVKELLKTEHGRDVYRREIREFRRVVPDATEAQAREAIKSRRRDGYVIDYKASAVEKSKFRDEFGKKSSSAKLGSLTRLVNRRAKQNEQGHGDSETKISAEGKAVARTRADEKYMTDSQRRQRRKLEADYYREYKIAMGYAA